MRFHCEVQHEVVISVWSLLLVHRMLIHTTTGYAAGGLAAELTDN